MNIFKVFDVAGSALSAQSVRLNTIASNLANADVVSNSPDQAYKARQPVFAAVLDHANQDQAAARVKVAGIVESQAPVRKEYVPQHPLADAEGYIYTSNVNVVEEMANMISASRSYQSNVEVLNTSKQLLLNTLRIGQ
ncbi:MAG: flagellar basal body rod protein FlgC [Gammaproteobacteria bacterium]|nr:flagellar basal body rod protein FlgC [Gammaproteobacteria bacterium]